MHMHRIFNWIWT